MLHLPNPRYTISNAYYDSLIGCVQFYEKTFISEVPRSHMEDAKQDAAMKALNDLSQSTMNHVEKIISHNSQLTQPLTYVSALENICHKMGLNGPVYTYDGPPYEDGWTCHVSISLGDHVSEFGKGDTFRSQRDARMDAAKVMYDWLTENL